MHCPWQAIGVISSLSARAVVWETMPRSPFMQSTSNTGTGLITSCKAPGTSMRTILQPWIHANPNTFWPHETAQPSFTFVSRGPNSIGLRSTRDLREVFWRRSFGKILTPSSHKCRVGLSTEFSQEKDLSEPLRFDVDNNYGLDGWNLKVYPSTSIVASYWLTVGNNLPHFWKPRQQFVCLQLQTSELHEYRLQSFREILVQYSECHSSVYPLHCGVVSRRLCLQKPDVWGVVDRSHERNWLPRLCQGVWLLETTCTMLKTARTWPPTQTYARLLTSLLNDWKSPSTWRPASTKTRIAQPFP